jgi:hypothetical protein
VWWERCRFFFFDVDCRVFVSSVPIQSLLSILHANRILPLGSASRLRCVKSWFVASWWCQSSASNFNSAVFLPGFARAQHRFFPRLRARLLEFPAVDIQSLFRPAVSEIPQLQSHTLVSQARCTSSKSRQAQPLLIRGNAHQHPAIQSDPNSGSAELRCVATTLQMLIELAPTERWM